jgi:hypothetical protein
MGVTASINGNRLTEARVSIPAWGLSYCDLALEGEVKLAGKVAVVVADLTIFSTVLSGGPGQGRSFFRTVSGAGGWGQTLPKKSYANDAGVKLSLVLGDAAAAVGETLDTSTIDPTTTVGTSFTRPQGPACRVLETVAPSAWYVGEDGKTRLGARPATTPNLKFAQTARVDLARGFVEVASDSIAPILPGATIAGLKAVDVEHEWSPSAGLRSRVYGAQGTGTSRRLSAFRAIVDQLDPLRKFRGVYEYRIVQQHGNRLDLQCVRVLTGMPDLLRVPVRPGVPGTSATYALGSRVAVGFLDADPGRPYVHSFEDPDGAGFLASILNLAGGGAAVGRVGDSIQISVNEWNAATPVAGMTAVTISSPMNGNISSGSSKVTCG